MRRLRQAVGFFVLSVVLLAPSTSFAQQSLNFSFGGFVPTGERSRSDDDVLVNNLCCLENPLAFNVGDFSGGTFGAEYLVGLGEFFDAGLGVGYYKRSVPSIYLDLINDNGREIQQNLRLRVVPFSATIRFLPLGHTNFFEPYIGGGLAVLNWPFGGEVRWQDAKGDLPADQEFAGPQIDLGGFTYTAVFSVRF
jgi:hypothetical protein